MLECLRCNACGKYFTAEPSDDVKEDGPREQMYGHSARTFIAISKYYMGSLFYRQESLQVLLGVPISASTQYDQIVGLCYAIEPVYNYLKLLVANAVAYWIDDTKCRILDKRKLKQKM